MSVLDLLGARDIRGDLPHRDWIIGQRPATTSLTWHWNGPPVPEARQAGDGLLAQLKADANYQMRAGWGGTKDGAPHIMYTLVVDALGTIYQTADIFEQLWHCAHADGNARGLALHFPLGEGQHPTSAQLFAAEKASDILRAQFGITLNRTLGHLEWKHATACPGPVLMQHLISYRAGVRPTVQPTPIPAGLRQFKLTCDGKANVRQAPRTRWADGSQVTIAGTLKSGTIVYVDVVKTDGEAIGPRRNRNWVHMAHIAHEQADLGFLSETLGVWL